MVKREDREKARLLRQNGASVRDIALQLGVSTGSVSQWVRDITLTQAQIDALQADRYQYGAQNKGAKQNQERARLKRLAYQAVGRQRAREGSPLFLAGCMLFWAEGAKTRNRIYFANSDPNMQLFFIRFLREELGVKDEDFTINIHCHYNDPEVVRRIERYWLDLLKVPDTCLRKTQYKIGSDTRKNILVNGVCSIGVYSGELTHMLFGAIQEYAGFDNPDWLF
jgi:transposase-like protein